MARLKRFYLDLLVPGLLTTNPSMNRISAAVSGSDSYSRSVLWVVGLLLAFGHGAQAFDHRHAKLAKVLSAHVTAGAVDYAAVK